MWNAKGQCDSQGIEYLSESAAGSNAPQAILKGQISGEIQEAASIFMHPESIKMVASLLRGGLDRAVSSPETEMAKWSGEMKNEIAGLVTIFDRCETRWKTLLFSEADDLRPTHLQVGTLIMDLIDRRVCRGKRKLSLLPREFAILEYFMRHPNKAIMRATLLKEIWHYVVLPETNVIDVHVGNLRRKVDLPNEVQLFHTVRGVGFMMRDGHGEGR